MVASLQIVCDGSRIVAISSTGEMLLNTSGLSSRNYTRPEMTELARGLVEGLAFLHSKHIYPGMNISVENILVTQSITNSLSVVFQIKNIEAMKDKVLAKEAGDFPRLAELLKYVWTSSGRTQDLSFCQKQLIEAMKGAASQISMDHVRRNVALWSKERAMEFLTSVSEVLELKQRATHWAAVEAHREPVVGGSWLERLHPVLRTKVLNDARKKRVYEWSSVVDLVRVVRNWTCHYHSLTPQVRGVLGPYDDLGAMWTSLFPRLLSHVHGAMAPFQGDTNCARINMFY